MPTQRRGTRAGRRRLQGERASRDLQPSLPDFQAVAFVGTMAGQMIRWGFMGCRSPAWAHGFVTMTLAFVVVVVLKIVWPARPDQRRPACRFIALSAFRQQADRR